MSDMSRSRSCPSSETLISHLSLARAVKYDDVEDAFHLLTLMLMNDDARRRRLFAAAAARPVHCALADRGSGRICWSQEEFLARPVWPLATLSYVALEYTARGV